MPGIRIGLVGDVLGPLTGSTNNAIVVFDGTDGKLLKNSVVTIDGAGNMTGVSFIASGDTANTAAAFDASKKLVSSATTDVELGYVHGVTSAIQTQLGTKVDTLAAVGAVPNANGAVISGTTLTLEPADATNPGVVTAGAQTFGGAKVFSSTISASNLSGSNTGDVTLAAVGAIPNANGGSLSGQALTLQPANTSFPGVLTAADWNTFNGKQAAGNYITALTADVTASGPGSVASTVAKIQGTTVSGTTGSTNVAFSASPTFSGTVTTANLSANASAAATVTLGGASSTAIQTINGGMQGTVRSTSSSFTVDTTTTDYIILMDCSGAAKSITLPTPTAGRILIIKDSTGSAETNNITLVRHAAEQIEGIAASKVLQTAWGSWTLTSDGTNWFFI